MTTAALIKAKGAAGGIERQKIDLELALRARAHSVRTIARTENGGVAFSNGTKEGG